eukprot:scaffold3134_cov182-Amphora_coffeaeformis.AAC.13
MNGAAVGVAMSKFNVRCWQRQQQVFRNDARNAYGVSGATWLGMPPGKLNCLNSFPRPHLSMVI